MWAMQGVVHGLFIEGVLRGQVGHGCPQIHSFLYVTRPELDPDSALK